MSPEDLARLLAEAVPDGTFGGQLPESERQQRPSRRPPRPVTEAEAAEHRAVLAAAIAGFDSCKDSIAARGVGPRPPRHLHAVPKRRAS